MKPIVNVTLRVITILCMVFIVIASIIAHKPIYVAVWTLAAVIYLLQLIKYVNKNKESLKKQ